MAQDTKHDLLFYDGDCGFCHRTVQFILRHDPEGKLFRFAPIGGPTYTLAFPAEARQEMPDSIILKTADGRTLVRSDAVRHIGERLGRRWATMARLTGFAPRRLLDIGYDGLARIRRRLFPPPPGACPILPADLRERFHP